MGAKVTVKVRYPRPDMKATRVEIDKVMKKFIFKTLKTWVLETVSPIPVWSGASRASFLFLAAKAFTSLTINPVAPDPPGSRISLGVTEAEAEVLVNSKTGEYGWTWRSTLSYIGVVESRNSFVSAGLRAIANKQPILPQPIFKPTRGRK